MSAAKPKPTPAPKPAAPAESSSSPPPPPKRMKKEKKAADPDTSTIQAIIKALIKAKENDTLTDFQTKQFETLVKEIRTKGPAAVQKKLRAELREIYRTGVYGK